MYQYIARLIRAIMNRGYPGDNETEAPNDIGAGATQPEVAAREDFDAYAVGHIDQVLSGWANGESKEVYPGFAIAVDDNLVDVGCGSGGLLPFCAQLGANIYFVEADEAKVAAVDREIRAVAKGHVEGHVSNSSSIPLPSGSMDKVIAREVMEHVEDPDSFTSELARIGKPGAKYLITVPDPASENLLKHLAAPVYFEKPNHIHIFERDQLRNLVEKAGLTIESHTFDGFYFSMWWILFWACPPQNIDGPWDPMLLDWASTWDKLLKSHDAKRWQKVLNNALPRSQIIIAHK